MLQSASIQRVLFCLCALLCSIHWVSAQPAPIKWGDVPLEDLQMKDYPADPNANAVILCDYGEVSGYAYGGMKFFRHKRIKILTEDGYKLATVELYSSKDFSISNLEAQTIILGEDGSVKKNVLTKKDFFKEKQREGQESIKFTLPALAKGVIIEYRYQQEISSSLFMPNWRFQDTEPTRWSEMRAIVPKTFGYVRYLSGLNHAFEIDESGESKINGINVFAWRLAQRDLQGLRKEPYMTSLDDQFLRVDYQLAYVIARDLGTREDIMTTWEDLAKRITENPEYKAYFRNGDLKNTATTLVAGMTDPVQKMQAIYDYVRKNITWNDVYSSLWNRPVKEVLTSKQGDSGEISLVLTAMLRAAELDAYPLMAKVRESGRIIELYPIVRQFNYAMTAVKVGDKTYILDATDKDRPYNLLPVRALNYKAFMLDATKPSWVRIATESKFRHVNIVTGTLAEDGTLKGKYETLDEGYSGREMRQGLSEKTLDKFVKEDFFPKGLEPTYENVVIQNKEDETQPLMITADITLPNQAQVVGDMIYVNPLFFSSWKENPFKSPERFFDVDFSYPMDYSTTVNLTLPEGYTVDELPKPIVIQLSNSGGEYRRLLQLEGNQLSVVSRLRINYALFGVETYKELRAFFDQVVTVSEEQVVLKKKTEEAVAPPPPSPTTPAAKPAATTPTAKPATTPARPATRPTTPPRRRNE